MNWIRQPDIGLLILRVSAGLMMFSGHGLGKLGKIGTDAAAKFSDPFGIGAVPSQFLAASAEGIGSILLIVGLLTRGSALALAFTMFVAAFIAHANDPFFAKSFVGVVPEFKALSSPNKEFALIYATVFSGLFFLGAGRYSLDQKLRDRLPRVLKWLA